MREERGRQGQRNSECERHEHKKNTKAVKKKTYRPKQVGNQRQEYRQRTSNIRVLDVSVLFACCRFESFPCPDAKTKGTTNGCQDWPERQTVKDSNIDKGRREREREKRTKGEGEI